MLGDLEAKLVAAVAVAAAVVVGQGRDWERPYAQSWRPLRRERSWTEVARGGFGVTTSFVISSHAQSRKNEL